MGPFGFAASILLLLYVSRAAALCLTRQVGDRFWVFILVAAAQLGFISVATSLFHAFTAMSFLFAQVLVAGVALTLVKRLGVSRSRPIQAPERPDNLRARLRDPWWVMLAASLVVVLGVSGLRQLVTPVIGFDERMYHASRVAYWLQHRSVFFYDTQNDRQTVFPFGAELFFAWPLLFVKLEALGRMVFWLAFPLTVIALGKVCRALGLSARAATAGALLYACTPAVLAMSVSLKSDSWLPLFLLACVYYLIRPNADGEPGWHRFAWAGGALALAVNVKTTSLGLAPGVALTPLLLPAGMTIWKAWCASVAGFAGASLVCGLAVTLVANFVHHGDPLGPPGLQRVVRPDFSLRQIYTHAVRVPLVLTEAPTLPVEIARSTFERAGRGAAAFLGADYQLPLEDKPWWPGSFTFSAPPVAVNYSLGGLLWLPCLALSIGSGVASVRRRHARGGLPRVATFALIQLPLFLSVVFLIRWMGAGPSRFWIGSYALGVPLTVWWCERLVRMSITGRVAGVLLLACTALPAVRSEFARLASVLRAPPTAAALDEPFQEVTPQIPSSSRVLLVGAGNVRDYPLFRPRDGLSVEVFPWGNHKFDAARMRTMLNERRISHVVVEDDRALGFHWAGGFSTAALVAWLGAQRDLKEVPLQTPHMRLFRRVESEP